MRQAFLAKSEYLLAFLIFAFFSLSSCIIWSGFSLTTIPNYDNWRIFEICILFLLAIYYLFIPKNFLNYKSPVSLLCFLFILFGFISILLNTTAITFNRSLRDWSLYSTLLFALISLSYCIYKHPKLALFTLVVMSITPLFSVIEFLYHTLFFYFSPFNNKVSVFETWAGQFPNYRMLGDTAIGIVFSIFALQYKPILLAYKKYIVFLFFCFSTLILATGGRGIIISSILALVFMSYINPSFKKQAYLLSKYLIICFIFGLLLGHLLNNAITGTTFRTNSSGRLELITYSFQLLKDNPFFGIGPAQFKYPTYSFLEHPHNFFIQILIEWGSISFISFCILLLIVFLSVYQKIKKDNNNFNLMIFTAGLVFIINCNFNGAHIYSSSQIYGLFFIAWIISTYLFTPTSSTDTPHNRLLHTLAFFITLSLSLTLLVSAIFVGCYSNETGGPRFWLFDPMQNNMHCTNILQLTPP